MSTCCDGDRSPDFNADKSVNLVDFAMFAPKFPAPPHPYDYCMDFNCDGVINLIDFTIFAQHWMHNGDKPGFCVKMDLVAHRAGENFGSEIPTSLENEDNPNNFILLTNNDWEEELPGFARDYEDSYAIIPVGGGEVIDDDLVKIKLKVPDPMPLDGTLEIHLSNPATVRLFLDSGAELTDREVVIQSPSGQLAPLVSQEMDIWLEGLEVDADFVLTYRYRDLEDYVRGKDTIHIRLVEYTLRDLGDAEIDLVSVFPLDDILVLGDADSFPDFEIPAKVKIPVFDHHDVDPAPAGVYYKIQVEELPPGQVTTLQVMSDSTGDYYDDEFETSTQTTKSLRFALLYQSPLDELVADEQAVTIRSNLDIEVVHYSDTKAELTTSHDQYKRPLGVSVVRPYDPPGQLVGGRFVIDFSPVVPIMLSSAECLPPNGDSYWEITAFPAGASVGTIGDNSDTFSLTVDMAGRYEVQLTYTFDGLDYYATVELYVESFEIHAEEP